jgi:alpha-L-rhamnosidase
VDERVKPMVVNNFAATLSRENTSDAGKPMPSFSLMTGFVGTAWVSTALSENNHADLAYRQLQQTSYPSWLYPVTQGATTIWERLNSYTHTEGFGGNNNMNSFNHYSFGAVGAWMLSHSLGIQRDENSPGFKHFILAPEPDPTRQMTYARGHYDSMYGEIESNWNRKGQRCAYHFRVPANTSATLYLNAPAAGSILTSKGLFSSSAGIKYCGKRNDKLVFTLSSGIYDLWVNE